MLSLFLSAARVIKFLAIFAIFFELSRWSKEPFTFAADLDVSHVLACDMLGDVPCLDGWVEGMAHPQRLNQKFGNPGITQHQLEEIEWFFIQRDCAFQKASANQPNLQVHYGVTMWEHCNDPHPGFGNTTLLLELLQSQVGCGGTDSNTIIQKLLKLPRSEGSSEQKSIGTQKKMVKAIKTTMTASTGSILSDGNNNNDWMQNAIKTQIFTGLDWTGLVDRDKMKVSTGKTLKYKLAKLMYFTNYT
jgi:hypothetical protein